MTRIISKTIIKIRQKFVRAFLSFRIFNPWFRTPEGIDFLCDVLKRTDETLNRLSPASRKAAIRYFYTTNLFNRPFGALKFRIRHGFFPPSFIAISPTRQCNLSCDGCFSGEKSNEELSYETVARVVSETNKMGMDMYVFIGGEPFCWKPLFKIIENFPKSNFGIYTNGTLIDENVAERLGKLGNITVCFSVEGFEKETDERRGLGTFNKVKKGMELCRKYGVRFSFSVTVTSKNTELILSDEFVDFFVGQGCFDGWYYQYMPIGVNPNAELLPTPEQREYRRKRMAEFRKTKNINLYDFLNDGPLVDGCLCAGKIYVHINAEGGVEPCAFYPFAVDNIKDKTLSEALKSPFFKKIRSYQEKTKNYLSPCPVVDHPEWLREAVAEANAKPDQETNSELFHSLKEPLDQYGKKYGELSEKVWKEEYKHG